jgi:hypothetical protein
VKKQREERKKERKKERKQKEVTTDKKAPKL